MLAFVRGARNAEHAGQLAERLDAIIDLTRQLCSQPAQPCRTRRACRTQGAVPDAHLPRLRPDPSLERILRNLDEVRSALAVMETAHPLVRHALDPLLVAYLRGEVGAN